MTIFNYFKNKQRVPNKTIINNIDEKQETFHTKTNNIDDIIQIVESQQASPFISKLFKRKFGSIVPDTPNHFIGLYSRDSLNWEALAYVHYSPYKTFQMCGGLVMDDRIYKTIPVEHRQLIKTNGGVAEILLRKSIERFTNIDAIWGHVGSKTAEKVDLRVGFIHTSVPHLMVIWQKEFPESEKNIMIKDIESIGPF